LSDVPTEPDPIADLIESIDARLRRGERPSLDELIHRHPERAEEIRARFRALWHEEEPPPTWGDPSTQLTVGGGGLERLGDYRIIRLIGEGGMGVVYEAVRESLAYHVALKVLHPQFRADASYLRRFKGRKN